MIAKRFSVNYASTQRLSAFYDVVTVRADPGDSGCGLVQGEIVAAEGIQIVRAKDIPCSTFINNPAGVSGSSRYMMTLASDVQSVANTNNELRWLNPRELFVLNTAKPWRVHVSPTKMSTVLTVEDEYIRDMAPDNFTVLGDDDCHTFKLNDMVSSIVESAWSLAQQGHFELAAPKIVRSLLDALWMGSMLLNEASEDESSDALSIRFTQAKQFIAACFFDNDLCVAHIAEGIGVSSRYLRRVFASQATSPSRYLYDFRLDMAAQQLRNKLFADVTITELAMRNGFNSAAHFSTEFKRRFGVSPREFRCAGLLP